MKFLLMGQAFQPHIVSSSLHPDILLSALFSSTLNIDPARNVRDHILHPYKIIVQYTLIFAFFDGRPKD
jgi:hypothetical protein